MGIAGSGGGGIKTAPVLTIAKKWVFSAHHDSVTVPRAERLTSALVRQIGSAASLLDVGAGDGVIAKKVGERVGAERVEGVDVLLRPKRVIRVREYDGTSLPFESGAFEVVTISDVLHHCEDPEAVLRECLRVAERLVVIKDHFAFGKMSRRLLHLMDVVGNARDGIPSPGRYFEPHEWVAMIERANGRILGLEWPLAMHEWPWRLVVRPGLHFVAKVEPRR